MSDINDRRRDLAQAGLNRWGPVPQMLMVAEESLELAHAVLKWRRAFAKVQEDDMDLSKLNELEEAEENVILESEQVRLMLELLPLVITEKEKIWGLISSDILFQASVKIAWKAPEELNP